MATASTRFAPAKNGFGFVNYFEISLPIKYQIPIIGQINLNDIVFGLCGGMCAAALDYYNAGLQPPDYSDVKKIDPKLFTYLCERQLDSLKISIILKIIEWMLLEDQELATRMARVEIPKMRRMIDAGNPAILGLIRVKGLTDPSKNHQVLATGYDFNDATKDLTIQLYDPNHPCDDVSISVNTAKLSSGQGLQQSTGEALRGFFVIPYKAQTTMPKAVAEAAAGTEEMSFGLEAVEMFQLSWPVDSRRINQKFGEHPENYRGFGLPGHEGLDLYALSGANVYAAANGEVYHADNTPKGNAYGLHVRIKHQFQGRTYHTVYAHLQKVFVTNGQTVSAGDVIGLADNSGNSFGDHLHLTLKIDGEQTPGYPAGVVDPLPYMTNAAPALKPAQPAVPLPPPSGITIYTTLQLNLRAQPSTNADVITLLPAGEALSVLGNAADVKPKIGQQDQWLQVSTAAGQSGFVAAWYAQTAEQQAFPPTGLVVYPFDQVNLRAGPGTGFQAVALMNYSDPLTVLGDEDTARSRLGQQNQWIQVQNESGQSGFVAAWLVHVTGQVAPNTGVTVYPTQMINIRARPSTDANILTVATPADPLTVLGVKDQVMPKIGQQDQWLNVRTPENYVGYAAAWFVQSGPGAPVPPASPTTGAGKVYPTADINLRAQPGVNSPRVNGANHNEPLTIIDTDLNAAQAKIGKQDMWVYVQKQDGGKGWAAAWYLSGSPS